MALRRRSKSSLWGTKAAKAASWATFVNFIIVLNCKLVAAVGKSSHYVFFFLCMAVRKSK
jgi:hypothetical protein